MSQMPPMSAPSGPSALEDPNAAIGGGVPQTAQGQQFLLEEQAAYAARGQQFDLSGTLIPPDLAGDFWAFYQQAEAFAAATGWRYLLTPQQLVAGLRAGLANQPIAAANQWMAQQTGYDLASHPWVTVGLTPDQYAKSAGSLSSMLQELTGQTSWSEAGIPGDPLTAIQQGWSSQQLQDWIAKSMPGKYEYLKYGYNYNSFQAYKTQNADALKQRYGAQYTDAQAVQNISAPLTAFHAQGGQFGAFTPYVKSDTTIPTGFQSGAR